MRNVSTMAACLSVLALGACGSGDGAPADGGEAAPEAAVEASAGSAAPGPRDRRALLEAFHEGPPAACGDNFVEGTDDSEGEEASGASFVVCAGSESSEEPYTVVLITEGNGRLAAGTMDFYVRADPHPLAYEAVKDLMQDAAGVESDAEQTRFNTELGRFMMAGPNMPGSDYRTLFQTAGGVTTQVAPNKPGGGWIAVRVLP